ncbi:MAG TPA: universal stress protein [Solirubrobacter sp.]|nr:universal stress protein [Solirubrobacter sp.]
MEVIVVAAKAGTDQPWVADAAAELAGQTGATAKVVSIDGLDVEALSPVPRSEFTRAAQASADALAERIRAAGIEATAETRPGRPVRGILLYAEEEDADLIVVGASSRGAVARKVLGTVPLELIERSRRPVLVVSPPAEG